MYDEFLEKACVPVSIEEYTNWIEPLYYRMPNKLVPDASAFCKWIKKTGLVMAKAIFESYDNLSSMAYQEAVQNLEQRVCELNSRNNAVEHRLAVYDSVFTEAELRERLLAKMTTEDLITAYQIGRSE